MTRNILLAGSTGLIGRIVCQQLVERPDVSLISLVRNGSTAFGYPIDFERLCVAPEAALRPVAPSVVDVAISCLGTTMRTAGSQPAMFRVDHDYVLALAKGAKALGARQFILVSSVGAGGTGFYLKTKGAIEQAVALLGFVRIDIIRPGFLLGQRDETRVLEAVAQHVLAALSPILPRRLSRYGVITANTVAEAIVQFAGKTPPEHQVYEHVDLQRLSRQCN
ncbi:NAD-dependent epimerase/dehydratase family protein [Martelella soudanensis]|uniref:NAD-dependent epimerase/dehydratase family protein n=1 Tax=unclassified Martelella TaxID=2629616 RepID=UPI0015DF82B9|nr:MULTISPECIES: NAD(P)H-binding protein [unclassified Martelella]